MELKLFEAQYIAQFKALAAAEKQLKEQTKKRDEIKDLIKAAMAEANIKSIDNDFLKITLIEDSISHSIDLKELEKQDGELYQHIKDNYTVEKTRKGYIKITVK